VSNFDRPSIINVNVAIAKAARVFNVQTVLTTVEKKGFSGAASLLENRAFWIHAPVRFQADFAF
jgi:hypothetical protein